MKNVSLLFFVLFYTTICCSQQLKGVWVSNKKFSNKKISNKPNDNGGIIIDFDTKTMSSFLDNSTKQIKVNRKETKIKIEGQKGKYIVKSNISGTLVLIGPKKTLHKFKIINKVGALNMGTQELESYLVNQQCGLIQGLKVQFTKEQFFLDKKAKQPLKRFQLINYTTRDNGYWYFKKYKKNVFFVFTTEKNTPENILQILEIDLKGFRLNQLESDNNIKNLTEIKTCL